MKIHHIGYLCKNIEKTVNEFIKLGYSIKQDTINDEYRRIKIIFLTNENYQIELIQPIDKQSPLYNLIKIYKNVPYHICYMVKNLESTIEQLKQNGYIVIQEPLCAPAIQGKTVCFLSKSTIGIIELLENKDL